jgi:hypothetical protein
MTYGITNTARIDTRCFCTESNTGTVLLINCVLNSRFQDEQSGGHLSLSWYPAFQVINLISLHNLPFNYSLVPSSRLNHFNTWLVQPHEVLSNASC